MGAYPELVTQIMSAEPVPNMNTMNTMKAEYQRQFDLLLAFVSQHNSSIVPIFRSMFDEKIADVAIANHDNIMAVINVVDNMAKHYPGYYSMGDIVVHNNDVCVVKAVVGDFVVVWSSLSQGGTKFVKPTDLMRDTLNSGRTKQSVCTGFHVAWWQENVSGAIVKEIVRA
jgi:hypothetical protein